MMFLTNQELFIAYCDAYKLQLDQAFIKMLTSEIYRRGLTPPDPHIDCYEKARMIP
ncbi:sporulation histidine kinase inhibitor Sda [Guptibacillus hwajinpoensis]|uniref:sporulation histidine kinase inhibitor Sda n=1 Tax=Guptibacillus hwajinpoensis TaxID=208199 RepID=UPI001CD66871|nr:sporulation histidine kinase inhibitor Sda [Pseudalkalibacillus hwajinpoensis]MCA0993358.1 sporulation histidine kinase inhibitor Sda [Pseudalkalibacillus hwajinpoensis]